MRFSLIHRQRISDALKGKKLPEETKLKMSQTHQENKVWLGRKHTKESRLKMSQSAKLRDRNYNHSEETKRKIGEANSKALKGKELSEEHKKKIGLGNSGKIRTKEHCTNLSKALIGRKIPQWVVEKVVESLTGRMFTDEHRRNISKGGKGKKRSPETCRRISLAAPGRYRSEETRRKISLANKGHVTSLEARKKLSIASKRNWKDPKYVRKVFGNAQAGPNKPERLLSEVLDKLYPSEWAYVGKGTLVVDGKIPDFMNVNGRKLLMEMFGDHWHSYERTGVDEKVHEQDRIGHFARFGYRTLIVWEKELQSLNSLAQKIRRFIENE